MDLLFRMSSHERAHMCSAVLLVYGFSSQYDAGDVLTVGAELATADLAAKLVHAVDPRATAH